LNWRKPSLIWLTASWLLILGFRWHNVKAPGTTYDPVPLWLQHLQDWNPWAWLAMSCMFLMVGFGLASVVRYRKSWPLLPQPLTFEIGWQAYVLMNLGAIFWMAPWVGVAPLGQQLLFATWQGLCLLPLLWRLDFRLQFGWWRWGLAGYGLALLGGMLYQWLVQPEPSINRAVEMVMQARGWYLALWLTSLCVISPALEEAWYRTVLSGPQPARGLFAAVVFGLVHCDPSMLLPLIWLGLTFAWARWGGGYWAAFLSHALWNVTTACWLFMA